MAATSKRFSRSGGGSEPTKKSEQDILEEEISAGLIQLRRSGFGLVLSGLAAGRDTVLQFLYVWVVAASIGFAHLHHPIAGTVEVLAGVFASPRIGLWSFAHFLLWSVVGSAPGGALFVGILKHGHARRS